MSKPGKGGASDRPASAQRAAGERSRGGVILVGAGPGAPDLITLRGARSLGEADVVVYDALAPQALLALAPAAAERIDVGRRGHEEPPRTQEEINALLVRLARAGKRVVRLKGGDPYVFGRGGEEASACRAAGVPFEVIPGVSSAIGALAYAGIPVTDRRHAASFAVVTGHKDPTQVREGIRWAALATAVDTLVILMGMKNLPELIAQLLAGGRSPDTPAAAVMNGTRPGQRVVEATLAELPKRVAEAGLGAPAAVVVGEVVRLRDELAWFEALPLFGRRVLVTRAPEPAAALCRALEEAGAEPVLVPMIRSDTEPVTPALAAALTGAARYELLVFTSANGVRALASLLRGAGIEPGALAARAACVGAASAAAAREAGFAVLPLASAAGDASAPAGDAAALLAALRAAVPLAGRRVLWPRAAGAGGELAEGLRAAGAQLDDPIAYRTEPVPFDGAALTADLARGALDALTFASPSAVRSFASGVGPEGVAAARSTVVAAIGRVTAEALASIGLPAGAVATAPEPEALVEALAAAVARRRQEEPR
jgi:uroporphyrinogen III methyltransferase/synthase